LNSFFLLFFLKNYIFVNCISFSEWITIRYTYAWMNVNRSCDEKQWDIYWIDKKKDSHLFLSFVFILFCKKKDQSRQMRIEPLIRIQCLNWLYVFIWCSTALILYTCQCLQTATRHTTFFCLCIVSKRCRIADD